MTGESKADRTNITSVARTMYTAIERACEMVMSDVYLGVNLQNLCHCIRCHCYCSLCF